MVLPCESLFSRTSLDGSSSNSSSSSRLVVVVLVVVAAAVLVAVAATAVVAAPVIVLFDALQDAHCVLIRLDTYTSKNKKPVTPSLFLANLSVFILFLGRIPPISQWDASLADDIFQSRCMILLKFPLFHSATAFQKLLLTMPPLTAHILF